MKYLNSSVNCNIKIDDDGIKKISLKSCMIVANDEENGITFKVTGNSSDGFNFLVFNKANLCWNEFYDCLGFNNECMNEVKQEDMLDKNGGYVLDENQIKNFICNNVKNEFILWVERIYKTLILSIVK